MEYEIVARMLEVRVLVSHCSANNRFLRSKFKYFSTATGMKNPTTNRLFATVTAFELLIQILLAFRLALGLELLFEVFKCSSRAALQYILIIQAGDYLFRAAWVQRMAVLADLCNELLMPRLVLRPRIREIRPEDFFVGDIRRDPVNLAALGVGHRGWEHVRFLVAEPHKTVHHRP